jgi:hypothetical protein
MSRKDAILRMAKIMAAGFLVPIAAMLTEILYFESSHGFYALIAAYLYLYFFGSYIKRMHKKINEQYPKDEGTNDTGISD